MLYQLKHLSRKTISDPVARLLKAGHDIVDHDAYPLKQTLLGRVQRAALESGHRLLKDYPKPDYCLVSTEIDGQVVPVSQDVVLSAPYGDLLRFRHQESEQAPKVLFVAAMSGHYATLSQDTIREFLPDHDVYITDWKCASQVPLEAGKFGFEEYVGYLIDFIRHLGPSTHVIGICQAAVPALVAAAVMAQQDDTKRPGSLTLMAGPIDIRVNPQQLIGKISQIAHKSVFRYALHRVPEDFAGAGRKVYPGWSQLSFFLSMNFPDHVKKHLLFFVDVMQGNHESAQKHREFYDEYLATMDGTGEFYLETLERVFFEFHLPEGKMMYRGQRVDCSAITDIPLFTVEGENDDLCLVGNTEVAHQLCDQLPDALRDHHLQSGVGHYGVFNGSRYRQEIAPRIKRFIQRHHGT